MYIINTLLDYIYMIFVQEYDFRVSAPYTQT